MKRSGIFVTLFAGLHLALAGVAAEPVLVKPNGGWCWFQDERVIVVGDELVFGTIAGRTRDGDSRGDAVATSVNLRTGARRSFTLHPELQSDDHDVPSFLALPDGRILATYQKHGGEELMRWRRTSEPGDISAWAGEQTVSVGASVSYSNPFRLGAEGGRILLFHRGVGYNPNFLVSDDDGATFRYGGRLLSWPRPVGVAGFTGMDGGRPYLKYAQLGDDTIHVISTEDHPRAFDNGIYHGFVRGGNWHGSDGRVLGPLSATKESALKPTDLTQVFAGDPDHVAWMADMHIDGAGHPRILFSVQRGGAPYREKRDVENDGQDHRYHYARWDGERWQVREIAHAGRRLYAGEDDYTGLGAIDPQEPDHVYISTDADPVTGAPLISAADGKRHWEIFKGATADGERWNWSPVTRDSTADNLRPIIPIWPDANGRSAVLWLRGTYHSYTDFDLDVMGLLPEPEAGELLPLKEVLDADAGQVDWLFEGRLLLAYRFGADQIKPYVKELRTLAGENIVRDSPPDHLHHHGLMYAVKINGVNFWEENDHPGHERHVRLLGHGIGKTADGLPQASFTELIHWVPETAMSLKDTSAAALLIERRTLTLTVNAARDEVALEWHGEFEIGVQAGGVRLHGTDYNGLGLRLPESWERAARHINSENAPYTTGGRRDVFPARWAAVGKGSQVALFAPPELAGGANRFFAMTDPFTYLAVTQGLDQSPLEYPPGGSFRVDYLVLVYPREQSGTVLEQRYQEWLRSR